MKKTQQILPTITILIILTFFISHVSADATFDTPPKHMYTGDSITVGIGDTYTNPSGTYTGVAGYRDNLQNLFGLWQPQIVGDKLDRPDNNTQLIGYHQPRHFGWSGNNATKWLGRITTSPQQHITWFSDPNPKNLIVIFIGSNDALQRGWAGPDDASELLAVAPIESYIDTLIAFDDTINIILCQIPPFSLDIVNLWINGFNEKLAAMAATKSKENLYVVDMYTPMIDCWHIAETVDGPFTAPGSCNNDAVHPNSAGYEIIAQVLFDQIQSAGIRGQLEENIFGYVTGDVQEGVTVSLYKSNCGGNALVGTTTTNSTGYFSFENIPDGPYVVAPEEADYSFEPIRYSVNIPQAVPQSCDFTATTIPAP